VTDKGQANPYSGSSLLPMLVAGLALTLIGMVAALRLSYVGQVVAEPVIGRAFARPVGAQ
jgi:hypothetical protein